MRGSVLKRKIMRVIQLSGKLKPALLIALIVENKNERNVYQIGLAPDAKP